VSQPGDLQTAPAGGGDPLLSDRQLPPGWGERSPRGAADGGEVWRPRMPARRWGRPVRVRAAPRAVRLHLRQRLTGGPDRGVRGSPPRALRPSGGDPQRALYAARRAGLQHRDEARVAGGIRAGADNGVKHRRIANYELRIANYEFLRPPLSLRSPRRLWRFTRLGDCLLRR